MMNKSLEYVRQRIINNDNTMNFGPEDIDNAHVNTMYDVYGYDLEFDEPRPILTDSVGSVLAEIVYNPNAEYNYFTTESCFCDGTLSFMLDLMLANIEKVLKLKTLYVPAVEKIGVTNLPNYKITYEVGDFVCNTKDVESPNPEKPWMRSKFVVYLPIKFTLTKREVK